MVRIKRKIKNYVRKLIRLVEMEREAEIEAMRAEMARLSAREREKVGRAINNLNGKILGRELGFTLVRYGRRKEIETEIKVGDLVLISKGNPLYSDLVGTVAEKGNRFITVALEDVPKWALKNVRIDLYANDITFRRMIDNLKNLNENTIKVLSYILDEATPDLDIKKEEFELIDKKLNESQIEAISKALATKDFFLIHGPFGTGKTRTILEIIKQEVKRGNKVLVTAESNIAVDNILERLPENMKCVRVGHPQRVSKKNIERTLAFQVEEHPKYSKIERLQKKIDKLTKERDRYHKPTPALRRGLSDRQIIRNARRRRGVRGISPNVMISMANWIRINNRITELYNKIDEIENRIVENIIEESDVVLSTNSSVYLEYLRDVEFDVVIVDEASQATIPSVLIPLSRAPRFILAGDHRQLPPTILNPDAKELEKTLFSILISKYPSKSHMLEYQYRMNPKLMEFPNNEFYNGKIKSAAGLEKLSPKDLIKKEIKDENLSKELQEMLIRDPLTFIDTCDLDNKFERRFKGSPSLYNPLEADICILIQNFFIKSGVSTDDIGIITPYDDQVDYLSKVAKVEVNTVDGYQGREKEIIIISMVRSNKKGKIGFLEDLRRLNVSLTRAKRKLVIIGDSETLSVHPSYRRLIEYCKENRFYYKLSKTILPVSSA